MRFLAGDALGLELDGDFDAVVGRWVLQYTPDPAALLRRARSWLRPRQLEVQTMATMVGCQGCGVRAELHGRRRVRVRDLPIGGRPVTLWWRKRIWRCREPACGVRTWTERVAAFGPRAVLTERARAEACRRVGKDAHAVAAVARDAIRLANTVVDQARRRVQQATLGHRGRKRDPLYRIRKLLLTAAEQRTGRRRARLRAGPGGGGSDR